MTAARCAACQRFLVEGEGCPLGLVSADGREFVRRTRIASEFCLVCSSPRGTFHHFACPIDVCPICQTYACTSHRHFKRGTEMLARERLHIASADGETLVDAESAGIMALINAISERVEAVRERMMLGDYGGAKQPTAEMKICVEYLERTIVAGPKKDDTMPGFDTDIERDHVDNDPDFKIGLNPDLSGIPEEDDDEPTE